MANKAKKPRAGASLTVARRPASPELGRIGRETLVWRLSRMDFGGQWSWTAITMSGFIDAVEKLVGFETLTWAEALGGSTPRLKRIPVSNVCAEAQRRLLQLKLDDVDDVWELRIDGKCRVWGLRQDPAFLLLWWDPDHTVCPSKKKHT